jgi:hypothetical protein
LCALNQFDPVKMQEMNQAEKEGQQAVAKDSQEETLLGSRGTIQVLIEY